MPRRSRRRTRGRTRSVGLGGLVLFLLAAVTATATAWWLYSGSLPVSLPRALAELGERSAEAGPAAGEAAGAASGAAAAGSAVASAGAAVPAARPAAYPTEPETPGGASHRAAASAPAPVAAPPEGAWVSLVIDDLGRSVEDVRRLSALGVPISFAVLPFESRTAEVVEELRRRRAEVLLHLPMEGRDGADPGPGALHRGMTGRQMEEATRAALAAVPGAVGVNNHMGSVLSADAGAMGVVLEELAADGLFFLDSRTTADSVGYAVARDLGVPAAERDVFLDPDLDPEAIRGQFHRLLDLARREGSAIAIGHPHPATLEILGQEVPKARELGYRFVAVSDLLDRSALPE